MRSAGAATRARCEAQLRRRIGLRYQTVKETVRVGTMEFPFTRIANPDTVLDEVAAEESRLEKLSGVRASEDQLHLPYWAELWDSAMGVAQFLVNRDEGGRMKDEPGAARRSIHPSSFILPPSPSVLDLGCGMGLAGTAAAGMGHRVLFADLEAPALLFARLNSLPWADRVRTRRLNWQTDRLGESFDLILGADILYEKKQWPFLEPFWRAHLSPGGRVLLGEPGRQTGDLFIECIASKGWTLMQHQESVTTREKPIRLFDLTLG